MSLKSGIAISKRALWTQKSTLSDDRRMMSPSMKPTGGSTTRVDEVSDVFELDEDSDMSSMMVVVRSVSCAPEMGSHHSLRSKPRDLLILMRVQFWKQDRRLKMRKSVGCNRNNHDELVTLLSSKRH